MREFIEKEASKALGAVLAEYVKKNGSNIVINRDDLECITDYSIAMTDVWMCFVTNARHNEATARPIGLTKSGVMVDNGKIWAYEDIAYLDLVSLIEYCKDYHPIA